MLFQGIDHFDHSHINANIIWKEKEALRIYTYRYKPALSFASLSLTTQLDPQL